MIRGYQNEGQVFCNWCLSHLEKVLSNKTTVDWVVEAADGIWHNYDHG